MRGRQPFLLNPWVLPASIWEGFCGAQRHPHCVLPKLSLFTVHLIRWLFTGKLRKTVPAKGRLASGEVNGKFQGSQEAQVGSETGRGWGGSLPCTPQPQDPMAGKAWEQAGHPPFLGSGVSHANPSSGREGITVLNWSNLDEDYMGILNCCTLGLPFCFSKDCTDRQACSYIYKEVR